MNKLTNKEEEILHALWNLKKAFVKDIIFTLPDPKPHYITIRYLLLLEIWKIKDI